MERHRQAENTDPVFGNMFKLAWGKDLAVTSLYCGLLTHQESNRQRPCQVLTYPKAPVSIGEILETVR